MEYTLWRRGHVLGETDLGYTRWKPRFRGGWFHLTDPAATIEHGNEQHLELRRADGTVVPTEWIDIRDTEYLLSLADPDDLDDDENLDPKLKAEIEHDVAMFEEWIRERDAGEEWKAEASSDPEGEFPRYQVQLMLLDDQAIP